MHISETSDNKVTFQFTNNWEQQHVGKVLRPYLGLRDKAKLAVNAVVPPSPWAGGDNWRLRTQVSADQLPDILDSVDDQGAHSVTGEIAGERGDYDENLLMDDASIIIRKFLGQVTREHYDK